jgi:hypothetical protein
MHRKREREEAERAAAEAAPAPAAPVRAEPLSRPEDEGAGVVARFGLDRLAPVFRFVSAPPEPMPVPLVSFAPAPSRDVMHGNAEYNAALGKRVAERDRNLPRPRGRSQLFHGDRGGPDSGAQLLDYRF